MNVIKQDLLWKAINWQKVNRRVNRLRQRIYCATTQGNLKKLSSLQKLALKSQANKLLAIKRVTQINSGKTTSGVDKKCVLNDNQRENLYYELEQHNPQKVAPIKRVYIPKTNGDKRPLGIPTVLDRCWQAIVKTALEPYWESKFEATSYGFRPGRGPNDAISRINKLVNRNNARRWILDADIEKAFDEINHEYLLKTIGNFPARAWIKQWLKSGIIEGKKQVQATIKGTPQGGVISPLLLNIVLHDMEKVLEVKYTSRGWVNSKTKTVVVRYADDFVVMARTKRDCQIAKDKLTVWLREKGLKLSESKTRVRHLSEGVNFLGFNIREYKNCQKKAGNVIKIKPSNESIKRFKKEVKYLWKKALGKPLPMLIKQINEKITGWGNYYRHSKASKTFRTLDHWMWTRQKRYSIRMHPIKMWWWRKKRYWGYIPSRKDRWVFMDKKTGAYQKKLSWIAIRWHIMVKGRNSVDDKTLKTYWINRQINKNIFPPYSMRGRLWVKQKGVCLVCRDKLDNGEKCHVHHIIPRVERVDNSIQNLCIVHEICHRQKHSRIGNRIAIHFA